MTTLNFIESKTHVCDYCHEKEAYKIAHPTQQFVQSHVCVNHIQSGITWILGYLKQKNNETK